MMSIWCNIFLSQSLQYLLTFSSPSLFFLLTIRDWAVHSQNPYPSISISISVYCMCFINSFHCCNKLVTAALLWFYFIRDHTLKGKVICSLSLWVNKHRRLGPKFPVLDLDTLQSDTPKYIMWCPTLPSWPLLPS